MESYEHQGHDALLNSPTNFSLSVMLMLVELVVASGRGMIKEASDVYITFLLFFLYLFLNL